MIFMIVTRILENIDLHLGKAVTIEGVLYVTEHNCYLVDSLDDFEKTDDAILVQQRGFEQKLLTCVPIWVGGPIYQDQVEITGILCSSEKSPFPVAIDFLTSVVLKREEEEFQVEI